MGALTAGDWITLVRNELFLFASCFFLLGALDEIAVDIAYLWMRLTGRGTTPRLPEEHLKNAALTGRCAVFIPAWQESGVIADTVEHALSVWPQADLTLYVGCYRNDPQTIAAVEAAGRSDPRLRVVVHSVDGPTCKADCLNRLYLALLADEERANTTTRMVVLHDAEDLVDPCALPLLDQALADTDFVQLPVLALPHPRSPWISGHYTDEFAEAHAKTMVVRDRLGGGVPGAGVGCGIARPLLERLNDERDGEGPFATGSLTEDYELGLLAKAMGARSRFLRVRTEDGRLIATRSYFPTRIGAAIRQKTRWIHGIALQGWDRLGWTGRLPELWMQLRDRRGPLAALLLAIAYVLVLVWAVLWVGEFAGILEVSSLPPGLMVLLYVNLAALVWRAAFRAIFTFREHGWKQAMLAVPRIVVSNAVAIVAARRAVVGYVAALRGTPAIWDKTDHADHPARIAPDERKLMK